MNRNPIYQYKIASGYNVAAGSLVNIESITPTSDVAFVAPQVLGTFDPGKYIIRGDGTLYLTGFPTQQWLFSALTRLQLAYLRTTYCSGGWSGLVTINTRLGDTPYVRYNAVMILPKPSESEGRLYAYKNYSVKMARLAVSV